MTEFVLLVLFATGSWGTTAVVPGFATKVECQVAGKQVQTDAKYLTVRPWFVCLERGKGEQ